MDETGAVVWLHVGDAPLVEPFFEQSLEAAAAHPFTRLFACRTTLDALVDAPRADSIPPAGLIFHMSRCGSTLAAQMLAGAEHHIVVAEAQPIDAVVQLRGLDEDRHAAALRAMVETYGRNRSGKATRMFVKLDSWHAMALPLFRRAFPETPWVFLHRDPVEVLVSHARRPGRQITPGALPPHVFDLPANLPSGDHAVTVLARICEAALAHADDGGLLIDYATLPDALFDRILPHFGIKPKRAEKIAMAVPAMRDAKQPKALFLGDSDEKQQAATPELRAAVARHLGDLRARLAKG